MASQEEQAEQEWDEEEEEEEEEEVVVIMDNGSGTCKAGLSTDKAPPHIFPEIIGKPRKVWKNSLEQDVYFGDEVSHAVRNKLSVYYPLENGIIENFTDMEMLWEYTYVEKLKVNPADHPVLLTEPPYNSKVAREKVVEIMFETFGVPSLNISIQGVLALLGQGRTTGLVLDSGEGVTHTIPIFDGYGATHCINRLDLAGRELNTLLAKLLAQEGNSLTTTVDQHEVRKMKETYCYVAEDPTTENDGPPASIHTLPDGREISLTDERWRCPEALFNPSMVGIESIVGGVGGLVWDSISRCDIDLRKQLLSNVVLSGGSTMFNGFSNRLHRELKNVAPTNSQANIRVITPKDPKDQKHAVWTGAHVFASLREMQPEQWMSYEDYEEYGAAFIHDKIAVRYN
jgi:actin-related protein